MLRAPCAARRCRHSGAGSTCPSDPVCLAKQVRPPPCHPAVRRLLSCWRAAGPPLGLAPHQAPAQVRQRGGSRMPSACCRTGQRNRAACMVRMRPGSAFSQAPPRAFVCVLQTTRGCAPILAPQRLAHLAPPPPAWLRCGTSCAPSWRRRGCRATRCPPPPSCSTQGGSTCTRWGLEGG